MAAYSHTQAGTFSRVTFAALFVVAIVAMAFLGMRDPEAIWIFGLMAAAMFVGLLLFHSLTVEIAHGYLRFRFGIGLIRRRFLLKDIDSAEKIRTRWWNGWGIKLTPKGWLFSVSGFDAVQIILKNGRRYCIGTDEPQKLYRAIDAAMQRSRSPLNANGL
jgi:hypothetical protein